MMDKNLVFLAIMALALSFATSESIQRQYKSFRTRTVTFFAVVIMSLIYFIMFLVVLIILRQAI